MRFRLMVAAYEKRLTRGQRVDVESCHEIDALKWRQWKIGQLDLTATAGIVALLVAVAITAWPSNGHAIRQAANPLPLNVTPTTTTFTVWTGTTVQTVHTSGPPTSTFTTTGIPTSTVTTTSAPLTVPSVIGEPKDAAIAAMKGVGLLAGSIGLDNQCIYPQGTVVTQRPTPGPTVLAPGATFDLTVSSGHDSKGKPCILR